jgi:hypothetical protein
MATKANPGKYDCYENAAPDEPMFVLLARDRHAPALVALWAVMRELYGEDAEKVAEARQCCVDMIAWAVEHDRKIDGYGAVTLAGVFELIRCANSSLKSGEWKNDPTPDAFVRGLLGRTEIDTGKADGEAKTGGAGG